MNWDWVANSYLIKRLLLKLILIFLATFSFSYSNQSQNTCKLDKKILYAILLNEGLSGNKGYEYIISFNNKNDAKRVKQSNLGKMFMNSRVLDCKNPFLCEVIVTKLHEAKITNLDLGAFQINYRHHKLPKKDYFNLSKSYQYACSFIESNIKKYGYNWYAIASYHSTTPVYNYKYQRNLMRNYKKVMDKLK